MDRDTWLRNVFEHGNRGARLDQAQDTAKAIEACETACSLLQQLIDQTTRTKDKRKLAIIIDAYSSRVEQLKERNAPKPPTDEEGYVTVDSLLGHVVDYTLLSGPRPYIQSAEPVPTLYQRTHELLYQPIEFRIPWSNRVSYILSAIAVIFMGSNFYSYVFPPIRTISATPAKFVGKPVPWLPLKAIPQQLQTFQDCSIQNLFEDTNLEFLCGACPLRKEEFINRQDRLAQALAADGLDAFMVEPGYTFSYYANVTQRQWEVWEPEERPFVMVVRPQKYEGKIVANTTFLVPSFEAERARLLNMPFESDIQLVTYEEHWNPYSTLLSSSVFASFTKRSPRIMVDEEMRDFISRGLATNGFDIVGLGGEVERVRQIKTKAEVRILRAVNTGTVEAVRAMRRCLKKGLTEDDVMQVLDNTLRAAGLEPFFDIVLFDEDASNPHGGTTGQKRLEIETMVLIDVGAHLHGYSSDICRSFFGPWLTPPWTNKTYAALSEGVREKIRVWDIVFEAQSASLEVMHENCSAADVDIAARNVITDAGYGEAFTHRVGHGIGIKAHESPYLHKGNVNTTLQSGMTFTSEPGVYLVDKFGVRHEDVLLVKKNGLPELLTGRRARSPWDP